METDIVEFSQTDCNKPILIRYRSNPVGRSIWAMFFVSLVIQTKIVFHSVSNFIAIIILTLILYVFSCYMSYFLEKGRIRKIIFNKSVKSFEIYLNGQSEKLIFAINNISEVRSDINNLVFILKNGRLICWKKDSQSTPLLESELKALGIPFSDA